MNTISVYSVNEEQDLIKAAKNGDNEAAQMLLEAYSPALKAASRRNAIYLDANELESACQAAFVEALHTFDNSRHTRLAAVIKNKLKEELGFEKSTTEALTVPERTISRYSHIMNKADNDIFRALELAPKNDMSASTFLQVHNILRDSSRLEEFDVDGLSATPIANAPEEAPEAVREQIKHVFAVLEDGYDLSPIEVQILSVHHGLAGHCGSSVKGFTETAEEIGLPIKDVRKHYKTALAKAKLRLTYNK